MRSKTHLITLSFLVISASFLAGCSQLLIPSANRGIEIYRDKEQQEEIQSGTPPAVVSRSSQASIALAKHLTKNGFVMYSAYWCPHCNDQKELFGHEAVKSLVIIECAEDGENSQRNLCEAKGVAGYPAWEINGEIESGVQSLQELAEISNYTGSNNF